MGGILFLINDEGRSTPYKIVQINKNTVKVKPSLTQKYEKGTTVEQQCWVNFYNDVQKQYKESECGVYCMYFLTELLSGKSFKDLIESRIDDDTMVAQRDKFYRVE